MTQVLHFLLGLFASVGFLATAIVVYVVVVNQFDKAAERKRQQQISLEVSQRERDRINRQTPDERARELLRVLLPRYDSRDRALDDLFYVHPLANPELTRRSIAAALYVAHNWSPHRSPNE